MKKNIDDKLLAAIDILIRQKRALIWGIKESGKRKKYYAGYGAEFDSAPFVPMEKPYI